MDSKRAADVLRGYNDPSATDLAVAAKLGAQALKAWAWVERTKSQVTAMPYGYVVERIVACHWVRFGTGHTPLAAVLDAMEKEGKG
mgnify:CR=1 FL=1